MKYFGAGLSEIEKNMAEMQLQGLLDTMRDAKEYGSILNVDHYNWDLLRRFVAGIELTSQITLDSFGVENTAEELKKLIDIGEAMANQYWIAVTNPPYMGISNGNAKLNEFAKKNYSDSKSDLFAVFIERLGQVIKENGYQAMITQHAWMFLSSYEKLREKLQKTDTVKMAHLGARAFEEIGGEVVQTTSFVMRKSHVAEYQGTYCRLIEPTTQDGKEEMFLAGENRYTAMQGNFEKIPGRPVAYWVSGKVCDDFSKFERLRTTCAVTRGLTTGNNELFLKNWFEVSISDISFDSNNISEAQTSQKKWFPYNKGGEFRTWYGNNELVVYFENNGEKLREYYVDNKAVRFTGIEYYFKRGITWSALTTGKNSFRYSVSHIFDSNKGPMLFASDDNLLYILGLLNSVVIPYLVNILNPSLSLQNADMDNIPYILDDKMNSHVTEKALENVEISKIDWDSFETSWDFKRHPLV